MRYNVEWSSETETIFFFSLLLHWVFLISVDDAPLLVSGALLGSNSNVLTLSVFVSINLHDLSFDIDEQVSSESEELAPFTGGCFHIDLVVVEVQ